MRTSSRFGLLTLAVICWCFGPAQTVPAARAPVSEQQLISEADQIIIGTIASSHSYWDDRHEIILTDYVIAVESVLKGETSRSEFTITIEGGEVGDVGLLVSEEAHFTQGERVLLYLKSDSKNRTRVARGKAGKLEIVNGLVKQTGENIEFVKLRISQSVHEKDRNK